MPYIPKERRAAAKYAPENPGELNFAITELFNFYLGTNPNYQRYNDVLGAIEGAKLELYRRKIAPYEDNKIANNGDVYVPTIAPPICAVPKKARRIIKATIRKGVPVEPTEGKSEVVGKCIDEQIAAGLVTVVPCAQGVLYLTRKSRSR